MNATYKEHTSPLLKATNLLKFTDGFVVSILFLTHTCVRVRCTFIYECFEVSTALNNISEISSKSVLHLTNVTCYVISLFIKVNQMHITLMFADLFEDMSPPKFPLYTCASV